MGSIDVLAVSAGLPVDDLLAHPEGGPQAAIRAVGTLIPDAAFAHASAGSWAHPMPPDAGAVLVSTFGATTLFLNVEHRRLQIPAELSRFNLAYQSVSMAYGLEVAGPQIHRLVALSPGSVDYAEGAPLPFEEAFTGASGASATGSFDEEAFVAAAAEWMFGCNPLQPRPGDRVGLHNQAIHALIETRTPDPVQPPTSPSRRGGLRSLFRRT